MTADYFHSSPLRFTVHHSTGKWTWNRIILHGTRCIFTDISIKPWLRHSQCTCNRRTQAQHKINSLWRRRKWQRPITLRINLKLTKKMSIFHFGRNWIYSRNGALPWTHIVRTKTVKFNEFSVTIVIPKQKRREKHSIFTCQSLVPSKN